MRIIARMNVGGPAVQVSGLMRSFNTSEFDQRLFTAYDPANFLYTKTYGLAPSNTTLTFRYLTGGGVTANTDYYFKRLS